MCGPHILRVLGGRGVSIEDTKGLSTKDGEEEGLALR